MTDNELSYASQKNYIVHAQQECNGRVQWKCSGNEIELIVTIVVFCETNQNKDSTTMDPIYLHARYVFQSTKSASYAGQTEVT